jgi:thioredoxin 1
MEGLSMLTAEQFDSAANFLDKAVVALDREHTLTFCEGLFDADVLGATLPVLVSVWTEGCGGCRNLAPFIDAIAQEYIGRARVGKLDAMSNINLAMKYEVRALPTVLLFKGGRIVERRMGLISLSDLRQMLDSYLELTAVHSES